MGQGGCSPYSGTGLFFHGVGLVCSGTLLPPSFPDVSPKGRMLWGGDVLLEEQEVCGATAPPQDHCSPLGSGGVLEKHKWWSLGQG